MSLAGLAVFDPFPAGMSVASSPSFSNTCGGTASPGSAQGDTLILKTVAILNDPVNGVTNAKNIPGAEVLYTLRATNTGPGTVDLDTTVVSDPISLNTDLFVGDLSGISTGPIQLVQGTPTSALSWTYAGLASTTDDVGFYSDSACATLTVPTAPYDTTNGAVHTSEPQGNHGWHGWWQPFL